MAQNHDNRKRAFADVVTIDAWHSPFSGETPVVSLHADIVFGTARVGGEAESPVRFRLSLRQAEIVVVIPDSEPLDVDRNSVARDQPQSEGKSIQVLEKAASASAKGSAEISISPSIIGGKLTSEVGGEASVSSTEKVEISATFKLILVTQSKTAEGDYRWSVQSRNGQALGGRPWDGAGEPRLKLIDKRRDRSRGIPPTVRVEVRCRREDLIIEQLELKNEGKWRNLSLASGHANRIAAAESYIRDRLAEEGFVVKNITEVFAELILGSVTAEPS